ncbi:purine/pyrimidine permease [Vagococcus lutrae]|uniref:purine/pyrimidine permease n=1 Tax=Vagococcus lutrae TaxID=81947 RepID=UPI00200FA458|nr:purine/pyrimidine permease [Vagococcus lutrae]UQF39021.1 purine/pyrimidine permease [Vagococcus lutrae]
MKKILSSFQWMIFILMGSIVIPVAVAATLGLDQHDAMEFVSRTLLTLGIAGILQAIAGHHLPIQEGPAGVWWGVYTLYAGIGPLMFGSMTKTLQVLSFSFILSGIIFILFVVFKLVDKISALFTPTVIGIYLILLVVQLSGAFLTSLAGITADHPSINLSVVILSLVTIAIAFICMSIPSLKMYATLISVLVGWTLFKLFNLAPSVAKVDSIFALPKLFPFGMPIFDGSMIISTLFLTLLLLTNLLASIKAVELVFVKLGEQPTNRLSQASFVAGLMHMLAGVFSSIPPVPISGSASFIEQTKGTDKKPFILGNILIILISLSPVLTSFFAALPTAVGYAALVPIFGLGTITIAMDQIKNAPATVKTNFNIAVSWFVGIGIMFLPKTAFDGFPAVLTAIFSNGLIVGTIIAIILEQIAMKKHPIAS